MISYWSWPVNRKFSKVLISKWKRYINDKLINDNAVIRIKKLKYLHPHIDLHLHKEVIEILKEHVDGC